MSGGAKLNNGTMSNDQSKLIDLQHLSTHQIARLTDVAPHFLFDDSEGKYNGNPEQAGEDAVRYLFRLLIEQAEDEMLKLLSTSEQSAGYTVHIDPNALIRGDVVTESNIVTQQVTAGLISRNDGREAIGYPRTNNPADDKLKTLGDTNPLDAPPVKDESPVRNSATRAAIQPLIDDAVSRIEAKTDMAFSRKDSKPHEERTIWGNVFAEEQGKYITDALTPINEALSHLSLLPLDIDRIAQGYAQAIRKRAADGTPTDLQALIQKGTA